MGNAIEVQSMNETRQKDEGTQQMQGGGCQMLQGLDTYTAIMGEMQQVDDVRPCCIRLLTIFLEPTFDV